MDLRSRAAGAVAALAIALLGAAASDAAAQSLAQQAGPGGTVAEHSATGKVRFVGSAPGKPIERPAGMAASARPETVARAFLRGHGRAFGVADAERDLAVADVRAPGAKQSSVRFQQVHRGVPVVGGELNVNLDGDGNVLSAGGELSPEPDVGVTPEVSSADARRAALEVVAKDQGVEADGLRASDAELSIFDNRLLGGPGADEAVLVWRLEVTGFETREVVLVNARTGFVELHFNQIAHAKDRKVCDANNTTSNLPCTSPVRSEGGPASAIADVNDAYEYSGDTYDFLKSRLGRDSLDGKGMDLVSTVRYCDPGSACPYQNAFWNGSQMTYGQGFATADDVVGHEFAHGLTEFTANLFYYYQSGAINESLSDVFGEFVDLTNGGANDTAANRWLMGEEIGAIRDMENPGAFGDPDRMLSANYVTGEGDSGGVHSNSGVNNKAAYLMVDGGTFNGKTITKLGATSTASIDKVAKIYYRAMTTLMTSGSDYEDLYNYLPQACGSLVGTANIVAANCTEVLDAVTATEMHLQPPGAATVSAAECPTGTVPRYLVRETFDGDVPWSVQTLTGSNAWSLTTGYATSGKTSLYGRNLSTTSDSVAKMNDSVVVPENAFVSFNHSYDFQGSTTRYDGGVVEYSVDGGTNWLDAGPLFSAGGYNGTIASGNPLQGRSAFTSRSFGYGSSRLDLAGLTGASARFRFRVGSDSSVGDTGWVIDDFRIGACEDEAPPRPVRGSSSSAPPSVKGDFNGDGRGDLAVGAPGESSGGGAVHIIMGGATGLAATGSKFFTQNSAYVGDVQEPGDSFGAALTAGDFDADGRADLAIGVPGEDNGRGAVHVLKGSPTGLTAIGSKLFTQATPYVGEDQDAGDFFGASLAATNLGRSTHADLAVGVPGENDGAGGVHVLYGSASGVVASGSHLWSQASAYVADDTENGDQFGSALAGGDFGGTAEGDLAIGAPGENLGGGAVHVLYGSADTGLKGLGSQRWSQALANLPDTEEPSDQFGAALAASNLGRSAHRDLAIGVPGENSARGTVHVIYGTANKLNTTGTQQLSQGAGNLGDTAEAGDELGAALAAANLGKTVEGDLAIGVPGENGDGGAVHVLYGTAASGVALAGSQLWSQDSTDVLGVRSANDEFGLMLLAANFGKTAESDLVIGAPGEGGDAGGLNVLYGTAASGLTATGNQTWSQATLGIADGLEPGDRFGGGL